MNLSFACSLRVGEILGLTWDNVHISDAEIAADDAHVFIEKELERVTKNAIEMLKSKDILFVFPTILSNTSTRLVLKTPKTESSVRKVWLPKTVAYILREWQQSQNEVKDFLGAEYVDYNLVIALPNGRPCENRVLQKDFESLKKEAGLPNVVFHSLRHSSTTYKLKLNHGDLKATQGDTGHAQIDMITEVYSHILDEDRKINAQKFEVAFYSNPDLREVTPPKDNNNLDIQTLIVQLQSNPELATALSQILSSQKT
jgi:integrase